MINLEKATIIPTTGPETGGCAPVYVGETHNEFRTPKDQLESGIAYEKRYLAAEAVWNEAQRRVEARRADSVA